MLTDNQQTQLREGAAAWGLTLDGTAIARFARLAGLLEEGNQRLNLTRVPVEEVVTLHFLDSLALAAVWKPKPGQRLIDVGTGAGFPGLALALAFPELEVTLLDGTRKKLDYIDTVIEDLEIRNARTLHGRAEEIIRFPNHRNRYDAATARAVSKLPQLAAWMLPLLRAGGMAFAYKSRDVQQEANEARSIVEELGGVLERVETVQLPGTEIFRSIVVLGRPAAAAYQNRRSQGTR